MVKAFENFEIWFVTGAQLLYGGDAVVQVDNHSKELSLIHISEPTRRS